MNVKSIAPIIFLVLLFLSPAAFSKSEFEKFIAFSPLAVEPDEEKNKEAANLLHGTWVLMSDIEGEKLSSTKPGFIHFLTGGNVFTSETRFNDGGWLNNTSEHHVVGSWEFNAEKSLPISQSVISEVVSYIEQMQKKVDVQDLIVSKRFPEVDNLRVDQRAEFLRQHQTELKDIYSDESVNRRGLRWAKEILPMLREGLADKQDTLYFGSLRTTMSPEFDPASSYKTKRDFERFHYEGSITAYLSGKKLHLNDLRRKGMRRIIFEKPPISSTAYPENMATFYQNKLQDAVQTRASEIYDDLNEVCAYWRKVPDQIPESAFDACRKQKDSLLSLGVTKKDEFKFIDEKAIKVPALLERLLEFTAGPISPLVKAAELPSLDYCISLESIERNDGIMARIEKRNYANTAFSIYVEPTINIKPENWDQKTFERYKAMYFSAAMLYLRKDGVLGISQEKVEGPTHALVKKTFMYYDPANTWQYADNKINLKFQSGEVKLTLFVGPKFYVSPSVQNSSGMDFYDEVNKLHLIRWNVGFLRNANNGCTNFESAGKSRELSTSEQSKQPSPQSLGEPKVVKSQEARSNKLFVLSDYAQFKVVPVDPNAAIAPEIKAMWAKGFYIHLKPDGNFGFNTDIPGQYAYLPVNRWKSENGVFTLTLDKVVYSFTLPSNSSTGETTLTTVDSTLNAFKMTYVTKEKGVR